MPPVARARPSVSRRGVRIAARDGVDATKFVKQYVSQMKTASVRELRQNFGNLLTWIEDGQEIQITKRRRVVARLVPEQQTKQKPVKMPNFGARLKKIYGTTILSAEAAQAILDENKGRY